MTALAAEKTMEQSFKDKAYTKVAWRLLPFMMACFVASFLDRVNIGFAKLTMLDDLGFSEVVYGLGAGIFFAGYLIFEVPSNIYMHKVGAKATISRIMVLWGLISASFMFVSTPTQFYVARFLLGAAEAGFYPGMILYLTYWFPSYRRGRMLAAFICAIPISGLIGGPLSGWILSSFHDIHGLAGWKWLFLLEAIPSVVLGIVAFFYFDNSPADAKWLSPEERRVVIDDLAHEETTKAAQQNGVVRHPYLNKHFVLLVVLAFFQIMGQYGLSFWLPSLIKQAGVTGVLNIGLVTAIPFGCAVTAMLLMSRSSDQKLERRWHLLIAFVVGAAGLSASAALGNNTYWALAALCVAASGCYSVSALYWNLPPAFLHGSAAAAGIAIINSFGNIAGFISPYVIGWAKQTFGNTNVGLYALSCALLLGAVLTYFVPKKIVNR